jgi:hypothetical protein
VVNSRTLFTNLDPIRQTNVEFILQTLKQFRTGELLLDKQTIQEFRQGAIPYASVWKAIGDAVALGLITYESHNAIPRIRLVHSEEGERVA